MTKKIKPFRRVFVRNPLRVAVIGVGYLGRFHAQKYAQLEECELIGIVDVVPSRAKIVGDELGVPSFTNYQEIFAAVQAVSIVVPTVFHYELAKPFLENGIHVLLEKPFASTLEEAEELHQIAEQNQCCLQIGHLERFNVVFQEFQSLIQKPQFIETTRIAPFPKRATDVDVILDLMIHDIDLVLALLGEMPTKVEALGISIVTPKVDLANARLQFANGCIVDLTASRVSEKSERKMRIFQSGLYLSLNYGTGEAKKLQVDVNDEINPMQLQPENLQLEKGDALLLEIQSFLNSIQNNTPPQVTAKDGIRAMEVAWAIKEYIHSTSFS